MKNKITAILDIIFPGYWPKDEEIFSDHWGKASLLILEHYPHPQQIRLMGVKRLSRFLKKHNTKLGEETAKALVLAAENSLCRPKSQTDSHCLTLKSLIQIYRVTTENIEILEREMARLLIQTPGVYLLSIAGISVKFAGEFVAEIGPIDRFCQPQQIMSFAGNVPYVSQSAQYEGVGLPLTKKGAKGLRPLLNQIALSLNTHSPQFKAYYQKKYFQKADRPGIAKIATANKFIRLAFCLMKNRTLFVPEGFDPKLHDLEQHHLSVYKEILNKLKASGINPEEMLSLEQNFLQKIKNDLEKAYGIERLCG